MDFSHGIDSVESMPGILKSPKMQALNSDRVERAKDEDGTLLCKIYKKDKLE
jgi:hypothetical protein